MINRYFLIFAVFFTGPAPVLAAGLPRDCSLQAELIFELTKAEYGAYNVWDADYGEMETDERFVSASVLESGNIVAVGEIAAYGKPNIKVALAEIDQRGRIVWDVSQDVAGLQSLKKMLATPGGFAVMGAVKDKAGRPSVWLGFFDKAGKFLSQKIIADGQGALLPEDFILQNSGKGFLLSASAESGKKADSHAVLYHLDGAGRVLDRHSYMPGMGNRILGLSPAGKDFYVASGFLRGGDGRVAGWILKLNPDGSLVWQQQYPRGAAAQINKAVPMVGDYILAAGETRPKGKGHLAGWVMMIEADTGNVVWQRYYTGEMDQSARDVLVNADGLGSVMMQVSKPAAVEASEKTRGYVRLLTVNPRGVLFRSDEYFNAEDAQGFQQIGGRAGERILMGRTDIVYKIEPKPGEPVETLRHGWNGWVVAAAPMESFADPCLTGAPLAPPSAP